MNRDESQLEAALIGSLLVDARGCQEALDIIVPEDFYYIILGDAYKAILGLLDEGMGVDVVIVKSRLVKAHPAIGDWLKRCIDCVVTASHSYHYAKAVKRLSYDRQIKKEALRLVENPDESGIEAIRKLVLARENLGALPLLDYKTGLHDVLESITEKKPKPTYSTGFPDFDKALSGSRKGEVNTWAAATNTGKSLILLNIAHRMTKAGIRCLFVGTEMSAFETVERHISVTSGVSAWKIRHGKLGENDTSRVYNALADSMCKLNLAVLDHPDPSINDIDAAITRYKPDVVFLDYLERFNLPKEDSMRLRVKEFMRRLKSLARKREVVIHLAAQLTRSVYGKENTRPTLADISESSAVEKESDRVFLMWNPKEETPKDGISVIETITGKNRHGRKGLVFRFELFQDTLTIREEGEYDQVELNA